MPVHGKRVATPNDPKLSDGGAWRSLCRWAERRRRSVAQAVTRGAVRCSAWLGVAAFCDCAPQWRWSLRFLALTALLQIVALVLGVLKLIYKGP
jgi:hypothetical protein